MSKKKGSSKKGNKNTESPAETPSIEDNGENATKKRKIATPTVTEIIGDKLTYLRYIMILYHKQLHLKSCVLIISLQLI